MSALTTTPAYVALLKKTPPKVIRTENENEAYIEVLRALDRRSKSLTTAEREFADLLTLLIEDFEERHYSIPRAKAHEVVRFLLDEHGLRQKDLLDIFGAPSIVSEIVGGKRELTKEHIRRLSARFHVSPEVFF